MLDPGGGPGKDPPDDLGPNEEEVEDLSAGPGPDNVELYRQKFIKRFKDIERAEERLKAVQAEYKTFKAKYFQAYSKHRVALKPDLLELERKVKQEAALLEKLKEKSGALKEKFMNEQRFSSQSNPAASSADQPESSDDTAPSTSAPLPPRQNWGSPAATGQGVESQQGALRFFQQMESPLRVDKFVFSDDPEELPEDGQKKFRPARYVQVERSQYIKMAPCNMPDLPAAAVTVEKELRNQQAGSEEVCRENMANVSSAYKHGEESALKGMEMKFSAVGSAGISGASASAMPECNQEAAGVSDLSTDRQTEKTTCVTASSVAESALPENALQQREMSPEAGEKGVI